MVNGVFTMVNDNGRDDGISGFGRTINEAAMDFYANMKYDNGSWFSESD